MKTAQKVLGVLLMAAAATGFAMAAPAPVTPEIASGTAGSAIALVSGIVLMIRGRRK